MDDLHLWRITQEPTGSVYQALLDLSASRCELFSFARRPCAAELGERTGLVERALQPFRISPAVRDMSEKVLDLPDVRIAEMFRLTPESLRVLREAPGLYSWLNPDRPESLCLYREDRESWLHSHAPSRYAWIEDPSLDLEELLSRIPGLQVEAW